MAEARHELAATLALVEHPRRVARALDLGDERLDAVRRRAVARPRERREPGQHRRVGIGVGRGGDPRREGRDVELVIGEEHERPVDRRRTRGRGRAAEGERDAAGHAGRRQGLAQDALRGAGPRQGEAKPPSVRIRRRARSQHRLAAQIEATRDRGARAPPRRARGSPPRAVPSGRQRAQLGEIGRARPATPAVPAAARRSRAAPPPPRRARRRRASASAERPRYSGPSWVIAVIAESSTGSPQRSAAGRRRRGGPRRAAARGRRGGSGARGPAAPGMLSSSPRLT